MKHRYEVKQIDPKSPHWEVRKVTYNKLGEQIRWRSICWLDKKNALLAAERWNQEIDSAKRYDG